VGKIDRGGWVEDLHSTCLYYFLGEVAGAPCVGSHGDGIAGEGVGFYHTAGDAAPHETGLGY
jgi:hypothetical protein